MSSIGSFIMFIIISIIGLISTIMLPVETLGLSLNSLNSKKETKNKQENFEERIKSKENK